MFEQEKELIIRMLSKDEKLLLWFQKWLDSKRCHCYHCGKDKVSGSFYYLKKSWIYPDGRLPICKRCMNKMFEYYKYKYLGDTYKAMSKICQLFDIYFDIRLFKTVEKDEKIVGRYIQRLNLQQNKNKLKRGYDASYIKVDKIK